MPYTGRYRSPLPLVTRQTDTALSIPTIYKRLINPHMASTPHVLYSCRIRVATGHRYRSLLGRPTLSIPTIYKRLINPHMASTPHVLYSCRIDRYRSPLPLVTRPTDTALSIPTIFTATARYSADRHCSLDTDDMQTTDKSSHGEYSTCDILLPYTGRYRSPLPLVTRQTDTALSIPTICKRLINPHMASTPHVVYSCRIRVATSHRYRSLLGRPTLLSRYRRYVND
ncbi:hypothetical protein J6590_061061 [Homalodisca vitripennis]|nr:hypothetical protein J6590_061061 [Homalodisca vitripennis]